MSSIIRNWISVAIRSAYGGNTVCNAYLFDGTDPDYHEFDAPYSGLLQVIVVAASEAGVNPQVVAGRQSVFRTSTDPLNDLQQNQYEITAVNLTGIVDATFSGRIAYSKDGTNWFDLSMGAIPAVVVPPVEPTVTGDYVWSSTPTWNK